MYTYRVSSCSCSKYKIRRKTSPIEMYRMIARFCTYKTHGGQGQGQEAKQVRTLTCHVFVCCLMVDSFKLYYISFELVFNLRLFQIQRLIAVLITSFYFYIFNCKTCNTHLLKFVMRNKKVKTKTLKKKRKYGNNFTNILFCLANWFLFLIRLFLLFFFFFFFFAKNGLTNCFQKQFLEQKTILFQTSGKFLSKKFPPIRRK